MNQTPIRIVVAGGGTGGHVQPAIAVAEELRKAAEVDLAWIGSGSGVEGIVAAERSIPFLTIPAGKLRRYFSLHTFLDAFRIPAGIVRARMHLRRIQPDVIFSTGGFVSVPTVIAGWLAGIPIITHEQTATIGLANRINARCANRVALAFESTRPLVPASTASVVVTGNPVRSELRNGCSPCARQRFNLPDDLPLIYVTGGSLGAQILNQTVRSIISELLEAACVVHQCGPSSANGDYPRLLDTRSTLPDRLQQRYAIRERIGAELADLYAAADLVIGRSGAGTIAELALLGKPSILTPLPGTASDEQTRNANVLADAGAAIVIPQHNLTSELLTLKIMELLDDPDRRARMSNAARTVAQPEAASLLAREILSLASQRAAS